MRKPLPPQSTLRELLDYDPETGLLRWKRSPLNYCADDRSQRAWNTNNAGNLAFTAFSHGYSYGSILNVRYPAHRIIWKWMTGEEPLAIDHINGQRGDNRWSNLRSTDIRGNARNLPIYGNNKSGHVGVRFHHRDRCWQAHITVDRKQVHLGSFRTRDGAITARKAAEAVLGFHPNHGARLREPIRERR